MYVYTSTDDDDDDEALYYQNKSKQKNCHKSLCKRLQNVLYLTVLKKII